MKKIRCAVIGVGYLGRFHAQKYQRISSVDLVSVCDVDSKRVLEIAQELAVPGVTDYRLLFNDVDAVSIAAATPHHFTIAKSFLEQGIHVLLEKPMTQTLQEADTLIAIAEKNRAILQIGHLERFNPTFMALEKQTHHPLFITSHRLAPYTPRGADVNVILDLMIHDIELIQHLIPHPIQSIEAHGTPVISSSIDMAHARLIFENHAVATITASRVSVDTERKMNVIQANHYLSADFMRKKLTTYTKGQNELYPGIANIEQETLNLEPHDALYEEIQSFIHCIQQHSMPLVDGHVGRRALKTAHDIIACIEKHLTLCSSV